VHNEFATDVQNQLCSIRSDLEGQVEAVQKRHVDLNQKYEVQGAEILDQRETLSNVHAKTEAHAEEIYAMKEQMYCLKRQLASCDGDHIHYHDNRVVLLS